MSEEKASPVSDGMTIQSHKGPYSVSFDEEALAKLDATAPENAHFIIDARVAELYATDLKNVLASPSVLRIVATEENKSLDHTPAYVDHLVDRGARRDHVLVALGGGIIQDITCFLATLLLRGIEWRFYPTTLLAQADSCIGSKSSINSGKAKNILGSFTPPRQVTICNRFLETLDERDVRSGIGEMLKVHAIAGPDDFDHIAADYDQIFADKTVMTNYIRRSLEVKQRYIEEDEFDQGVRNVFNYGHSFGHAIEAATNFAIPHGIAVTIGMDMANFISAKLAVGTERDYRRMHFVLKANYRGFEEHPVPLDAFLAALSKDKKNVGAGNVTLILPGKDGVIYKDSYINDNVFAGFCGQYLGEGRTS